MTRSKALWLKHDAHFGEHPKTLRLRRMAGRHADSAECGWWRIVEAAKRYGDWTFEDEEHLLHAAGTYARFVPLYRQVGMLDDLTIHNGEEYQAPLSGAERVARHRDTRNATAVTDVTPREEKSREEQSRPRATLPHLTDRVDATWQHATGRYLIGSGQFAIDIVDDACRRHPEAKVVAAILEARRGFDNIPSTQQLASALRVVLDPLPDAKAVKASESQQREADASRRRSEATLRRTHEFGAHADERHPACPVCREGAA